MPKLIIFDMDGVIFEHKNFWLELHKSLGTLEEGTKLTQKYLHQDYATLVEEVVHKLWKGKDAAPYYQLIKHINYLSGVKEVFKEIKNQDYLTAIISSGPIDLARRAQHDLGIDFVYANELVIENGKISGEFLWPVEKEGKKVQIIQHLCQDLGIKEKEVIFVGDSENDLGAFQLVGKSIAFNSHSEQLNEAATHIVEGKDLKKILPFLFQK
ncbi:MAG: HAD family phosphatase [Nanoarchaeota archaeon]|nr:HAD family phosphatase [Nanoarchaeota archaeon]